MNAEELSREASKALIDLGIEGSYGSVSCSTADDYPSLGVSQWEGINSGRGDILLSYIDGGSYYSNRTYSDLSDSGDIPKLKELLDSEQGHEAQEIILAQDMVGNYFDDLQQVYNLDDSRCFIYALCWCPTSSVVVRRFLQQRQDQYDIRNLSTIRDLFKDEYYIAADVGEKYALGYANRAVNTFNYVSSIDLTTKYGIPAYKEV